MGWRAAPARLAAGAILAGAASLVALRMVLPAVAAPAPVTVPMPMPSATAAPRIAERLLPVDTQVTARAVAPRPTTVPAAVTKPSAEPIAIKRIIDTGGPLRYGTWFWDDGAVPAGPITIAVDLKASVLSVFRGGYEIGTTAVIYGTDAKQTPLGTFPILQKDRHHFSSIYHHAPMPYMLRLTPDGVSIHASEVAADYATHGCIGVPAGFARKLFAVASVGDRVIVTRRGLTGTPA